MTDDDSCGCFNIYSRESKEPLKPTFYQLTYQRTALPTQNYKIDWNIANIYRYLYCIYFTSPYSIQYLFCGTSLASVFLLHQTVVKVK